MSALSPAQIRQLAAEHYRLEVTAMKRLPGEADENTYLRTADGKEYLWKRSRPHPDAGALRFQAAIMEHLAARDIPLAVPRRIGEPVVLPDGRHLSLQTWLPGRLLDRVNPITPELYRRWGAALGHLSKALAGFSHPEARRSYKWNPSQTLDRRPSAKYLDPEQREIAAHCWEAFAREAIPRLPDLRHSVNHNDGHRENILVGEDGEIAGIIDFGDATYTQTVNELAIGCAYAAMGCPDPLGVFREMVTGYHAVFPLEEAELSVLYHLIVGRLLITVTVAAENAVREPENAYLQVSVAPAWALLRRLRALDPTLATAHFRRASGLTAHPHCRAVNDFIASQPAIHPVVRTAGKKIVPLDLSVGSLDLGHYDNFRDLDRFCRWVRRHLEDRGAELAAGGYGEVRPVYTTDDFMAEGNHGPRWRTTHLGLDFWGPAGTAVYAPLPGRVRFAGTDPTAGGYGAMVILEHATDAGVPFFSLYGHLAPASIRQWRAGTRVRGGDRLATFGEPAGNGGWPPHLHFQVMVDLLGYAGDFPGVAYPEEAALWRDLCPDPVGGLSGFSWPAGSPLPGRDLPRSADLLARRKRHLGRSLSVSYARPLHIVRGAGVYLYDVSGRRYLDTVNNVAHVGHEHPAVVAALRRQAAVLNTNSRYLHEEVLAFAEELTATLPAELSVVHFVNSGSEANELALRMCEAWSGTRNMLAIEVGYHGNTGRTIDVSSYKFDGKGGSGAPPGTTIIPLPDPFRGRHRDPATAGRDYANYAHRALLEAEATGRRIGGFIGESILSCGGQIVPPDGYLREVYAAVRAHGGLCIADEVQVGLGRVGDHWWGFGLQGVTPDIVTIGKPLGNGHPLGAVVCTPAVAERFANGMEYFNTFGGNPVSAAVGRAVLRTVRAENLRDHARETGAYLRGQLRELATRYPIIGDVRGAGLFLGCELVGPDRAPAPAPANYLKNRMRELGFLMSTDGPAENVLKIKPPLCIRPDHCDQLIDYLDRVFREDPMKSF